MNILREKLDDFLSGHHLDAETAEPFLDSLINETDETLLGDMFRSWNDKGIVGNEIYLIAKIMTERMIRVNSRHETFVDIVGTGGSKVKTFNVSTAAAFVTAGAGVPVAKHGNRAATSSSGSADVLAELVINPAADPKTAERHLNEVGICFMFAPNHHRLSPTLAKVRRGLGFPTIFNCVGPLCNPASAPHQLIGVWDRNLVPKMAEALGRLGTKKSWVIHGEDGLDEISIGGPTLVAEVEGETIREFEISPAEFFLNAVSTVGLSASNPSDSASMIRSVLNSEMPGTPAESMVLVNAAAALYLAGHSETMGDALEFAVESIRGGHAMKKLEQLSSVR
jgi:anthranilate phosphoribosyltransferase